MISHFEANHILLPTGRYKVTLPKRSDAPLLGESKLQAVNRYMANERSILRKETYEKFQGVLQEYLDLVMQSLCHLQRLTNQLASHTICPCML